jgi:transcriptional regulator with XRE-family HTH domain
MSLLSTTRKSHGLTQVQLAKLAEVSQATISFSERGYTPRAPIRRALAAALGVEPEVIFPTNP